MCFKWKYRFKNITYSLQRNLPIQTFFVAISLTFHSKSIFSTMRSTSTLNLHPDNSQILNFPSKPEETRLTVVLIQTFELYSNMHHQTIVHVATTVLAYRLISGPFN